MQAIEIIHMIGSEFSEMTTAELENWIELCRPFVSKKVFGKVYETALAFFVCHKMKMNGLGESQMGEMGSIANGFAVSSISDGGTSISFAASGAGNLTTDAEFALTVYGSQYLQLRKTFVVPIVITGGLM